MHIYFVLGKKRFRRQFTRHESWRLENSWRA